MNVNVAANLIATWQPPRLITKLQCCKQLILSWRLSLFDRYIWSNNNIKSEHSKLVCSDLAPAGAQRLERQEYDWRFATNTDTTILPINYMPIVCYRCSNVSLDIFFLISLSTSNSGDRGLDLETKKFLTAFCK